MGAMDRIAELRALSPARKRAWLASLSTEEQVALRYYWPLHARDEQRAPSGEWVIWLFEAGRGCGKTRSGAEWILEGVQKGECKRIALVARTAADVRDTMVEGESGILACSHPSWRPRYEPSKRRLTWPNGAIATTYSADQPDLLRGPQHDRAWADEVAAWRYEDAWDQLQFGLRLGNPRVCVTTTPRPTALMRRIRSHKGCVRTTGTTYDNRANLAPAFFDAVIARYEGTRLGEQELKAKILEDVEGALWTTGMIDATRVQLAPAESDVVRAVVAVDPAMTAASGSNETGIIIACRIRNDHYYVLEDLSGVLTPSEWGTRAAAAQSAYRLDRVVAETNQGGDLVEANLRAVSKNVPYRGVHASKGKRVRAEPIAALYEQKRVHHVGYFPELEQQLTEWVPGDTSPDRLDALVYALSDLSQGVVRVVGPAEGLTERSPSAGPR